MSDIIDKANDQAQMILERQIALSRGNITNVFPNTTGKCWECDRPIHDGRRWCNKECTENAEKGGW
tara:strand:+ start:228 stop:425 length:198 start_codon:yes stop_codon:yes gene_type:complete